MGGDSKLQVFNRGGKEIEPFVGSVYGFQSPAEEGDDEGFSLGKFRERVVGRDRDHACRQACEMNSLVQKVSQQGEVGR